MRFIALLLLIACTSSQQEPQAGSEQDPGPRSGLAEDAVIRQLSSADRTALCTWWGETLGVGRTQGCAECSGNACTDYDVSVATLADCVAWLDTLSCDATVRDAENCAFAQDPDLCASPAACDIFDAC